MENLKKNIRRISKNIWRDVSKNYIVIIVIALYIVVASMIFDNICPSKIFLKLPCPGCGLTRASLSILTGHFAAALKYNATAYLWVVGIAFAMIQKYVLEKKFKFMNMYWIVSFVITILYFVARLIYYTPLNFPV